MLKYGNRPIRQTALFCSKLEYSQRFKEKNTIKTDTKKRRIFGFSVHMLLTEVNQKLSLIYRLIK